MEEYAYAARDVTGEVFQGRLEAASQREAAKQLQEQGLFVAELKKISSRRRFHKIFARKPSNVKYVAVFCRQLLIMQNAGLSIHDSIQLAAAQEHHPSVRRILLDISEKLQSGSSLQDAMKTHDTFFPHSMIYLIGAGESSGRLEAILEKLAAYHEKAYASREKLKTLMLYPAFLLAVAGIVVVFILQFILPVFVVFFADMQVELPLLTRMLLRMSQIFTTYSWLLLTALALFLLFIRKLRLPDEYRLALARIVLRMPLLGSLRLHIELMNFSNTLAVLLASGLPTDQALGIVSEITENRWLHQIYLNTRDQVANGYAMSAALKRQELFPLMFIELLAVGEATGEMELMLQKIADFCQLDIDRMSERLQALMEPVMILVLGVFIGILVLAIAMPILNTITAFS